MTTVQKIIKYLAMAFAIALIIAIISGILQGIGVISILTGNNNKVSEDFREITVASQINELDIEIEAAELEIKSSDRFYIETNKKSLDVKEINGKLTIDDESKNFIKSDEIKIILYIPQGTTFKNAELTTGAGRVTVTNLSSEKLDIELGAGEFIGQGINASVKTELNGGAGKLTIKESTLKNLDFEMGVGAADITGDITGISELDLGVGSTNLTINGNKRDYSVQLNKGIGGATIDGQEIKDGAIVGDGANILKINGGVGEIKLNFAKNE
jgi:hypothetical protein